MTELNAMSLAELKALQKDVEKAISTFEKRKKAEALQALQAAAKEHGYNLNDLLAETAPSKAARKAKFANPADPRQTWSGRGRQPAWYREAIAEGRDPSDLTV